MLNRYLPFLIFGLIFVGCGKPPTDTKNAAITIKVARQDLEDKVVESGQLDAVTTVEVKSRVSGRLKKLYVKEGDVVHQGDIIAVIDPKELVLQTNQVKAQLKGAQSAAARSDIELAQRRVTAAENYKQAQQKVRQLEMLAKAQPALTNSDLATAKAAVDSAKQEIARLTLASQPNQRTSTNTALSEAKSNLDNAQYDLKRQQDLLAGGYVSQKVVEDSRQQYEIAKVRYEQAQENQNRINAQLQAELQKAKLDEAKAEAEYNRALANRYQNGFKNEDYRSALADLEKARIALQDVPAMEQAARQSHASAENLEYALADNQRNLAETEIRAPQSGVVTKKLVQEGELVASLSGFNAGTPIVRIEDRSQMQVTLNVNEIDTAKLKLGMAATIQVEALPDKEFTGRVEKIAPAGNNVVATGVASTSTDQVVRYEVKIYVNDRSSDLRSGMTAKCTVVTNKQPHVLAIPADYLVDENGEKSVRKVTAEKKGVPTKIENVKVKIGHKAGANVEILSGVSEGDEIARADYKGPERAGFIGGDD